MFLDALVEADVIPYNNIGSVVWSPMLSLCKEGKKRHTFEEFYKGTVLYRPVVTW